MSTNEQSLWARSILTAATTQQLNDETLISEIRFIPPGLDIVLGSQTYDMTEPAPPVLRDSGHPFRDLIREAAVDLASLMQSLTTARAHVQLGVTGGYDSRAVLAAAVPEQATVTSHTQVHNAEQARDREMAGALTTTYDLPFEDAMIQDAQGRETSRSGDPPSPGPTTDSYPRDPHCLLDLPGCTSTGSVPKSPAPARGRGSIGRHMHSRRRRQVSTPRLPLSRSS